MPGQSLTRFRRVLFVEAVETAWSILDLRIHIAASLIKYLHSKL